jgi:chromate transporter
MTITPPSLSTLFVSFLRLGMTAFGGPSMVAYIRKLAVERKGWIGAKAFGDGVAFCQMVPGATAMQAAAYVGLYVRGVAGAAVTFVGFGLPAFCLMLAFAVAYAQTGTMPAVVAAFSGLQAIVVAIVANAALSFGRTTLKHWRHALLAFLAAALFWENVNSLLVILVAGLAGWLILSAPLSPAAQGARAPGVTLSKRPVIAILAAAGIGLAILYALSSDLFHLAWLMMRVDLMAFGGGFASVPIMYREVVDVNGWLSSAVFMNGIVLGQVTPGPVVITATFIGYMLASLPGAIIATVSIFLPSFLIVIGVSPFFGRLSASPVFRGAIQGVLCSFVGLLVSVALRFALQIEWDAVHVLLAVGAMVALLRGIDILWVVLGGVILSVALIAG